MNGLFRIATAILLSAAVSPLVAQPATYSGLGVVQSLDRAKGEVTLHHEAIAGLKWPAMTMVFQVKESRLFDRMRPGQRVAFEFAADGKDYVVSSVIALAEPGTASEHAHHEGMGMMSGSMQAMMRDCMAMMKK